MSKVSIVLPVYNGEAYLKASIESILNQSYSDFELIIVDDCSMDQTPEIVQRFLAKNPNIIYIRNETNQKLPEALNIGFSRATGTYWTWTSCDNLFLPNAIKKMVSEMEKSKDIGLVYASMEVINEDGEITHHIEAGAGDDLIFRNVVGACFLYKADIARQVGSYNRDAFLCEDYEYWVRLSIISTLKPIKEYLYQYRMHRKSLSHNHEREIIAKGISVQKKYYPQFVKSRERAARFYAHLRARDIYNPFRQFYLLVVLFYSPTIFLKEIFGILAQRLKTRLSSS